MKSSSLYVLSTLTLVAVMLSSTLLPAWAATYTPGVKAGDSVKYADLKVSWQSSQPKPSFIKDVEATNYLRFEVQSVSGANVTIKTFQNFKNGTADKIETLTGNLQTQSGNLSSSGFALLVAGGLGKGDKIYDTAQSPTINDTIRRNYARADRDVNLLNSTFSQGGSSTNFSLFWDKATGAAVEISVKVVSTSANYTADYKATETNLWSPTILGIPELWFYVIIAAVVAIVVIAAVVMMMRVRKPATPPTTTPAPPSTPTG